MNWHSKFRLAFLLFIQTLCTTLILRAQDSQKESLAGYWLIRIDYLGQPMEKLLQIRDDHGALTGKYVNEELNLSGKREGNRLILETSPGASTPLSFEGRIAGGGLSGSLRMMESVTGKPLLTTWKASPFPVERKGTPKKYDFSPSAFHLGYSADIPPALHCWPGDTIQTETVDCNGFDKAGVHRVMEGNAEIGPFYIESAMPGDVLVIHFQKIRLNRNWASSAVHLMGRAISHDYAAHAKLDDKVVIWNLDINAGKASPVNQSGRLQHFQLPVRPMLGCVGVAPAFGVYPFPAIDSGPFGGNMDFVLMNEGTTLYLPVFRPGALLFMGDGHALQGDGELNLDALETSLDVTFTVELMRGKAAALGQPRAENEKYLMAIGLNATLDEALRDATTEMATWLEQDYGLTPSEVSMVLGTSLEYQITEVADRNVSVVAKIDKARLRQIDSTGASH